MAQGADGNDSLDYPFVESTTDFISTELTPTALRCTLGACPSVYKTQQGKLVIIGKRPSLEITETIKNKIGDDEWAIVIDPDLLTDI
jgi:hypothetical protein